MGRDYANRKAYNAAYNKRHYHKNKESILYARRLKKYQITHEDYLAIMQRQNNRCAICRCEEPRLGWAIDHCHSLGHVRGILCTRCNFMTGFARDNPDTLEHGAAYLRGMR